jgi:hypothetical protein
MAIMDIYGGGVDTAYTPPPITEIDVKIKQHTKSPQ